MMENKKIKYLKNTVLTLTLVAVCLGAALAHLYNENVQLTIRNDLIRTSAENALFEVDTVIKNQREELAQCQEKIDSLMYEDELDEYGKQ